MMADSGLRSDGLMRVAENGADRLSSLVVSAVIVSIMAWFAPEGPVQTGLAIAQVAGISQA